MPNQLSITVGPVYKTLKQARSIREIWAASYFFSALMREILKGAEKDFGPAISPTLLPDDTHRFGAGIYPDRSFWIVESPEKKEVLQTIITNALTNLSEKIGVPISEMNKYVYLFGHLGEIAKNAGNNGSDILAANKVLDNLELEEYVNNPPSDILESLVSCIQKLYKDGHRQSGDSIFEIYNCKGGNLQRLPSLIEIATRDLKWKNYESYQRYVTAPINKRICELVVESRNKYNEAESEGQDSSLKLVKAEFGKKFKFRHKYVAFIKADGDFMGSTLGLLGNDWVKIEKFSNLISTFASDAVEIIHKYGGLPIYAGGDDLLFTLPLANSNLDTAGSSGADIFELTQKLDAIFPSDSLADLVDTQCRPRMSYGISFCYYKYPMAEILEAADNCLNHHAKKNFGKNAVAFSLRKHSGQTVSATIGKGDAYNHFVTMMGKYRNFEDEAFLSGLMYKLDGLKLLLSDAVIYSRLEYLFKNQFNEDGHIGKYKEVLKDARKLLAFFYAENLGNASNVTVHFKEKMAEKSIGQLFACLRIIQFYNQDDHE